MRKLTNGMGTRSWTIKVLFGLSLIALGVAASSVAQDVITAVGNISATGLTLTGLNCTGNLNGGTLTTNASGVVSCSDDDAGGGGGSNVMLLHGGATLNSASLTRYGFLQRNNQTNVSTTAIAVPRSGTLKNLYVTSSGTVTGSGTATVTVQKGATIGTLAATTLTVTIDNMDGGAVVSDTSNSVSVSAGEVLIIQFVSNGSYADNITFNTTFELESP